MAENNGKNIPDSDRCPLFTEWRKFAEAVIPDNASLAQKRCMQHAFMGGALVAFEMLIDPAVLDAENPEVELDKRVRTVMAEIAAFGILVKAGVL